MITLYAIPFACSFAIHCSLALLDRDVRLHWVHRGPRRQVADASLVSVHGKRKVPVLVLPDGEVLTEMVGVSQYLDDLSQQSAESRRRHLEWLAWLNSELHAQVLAPLFDPDAPAEQCADVVERLLPTVWGPLDRVLSSQDWLTDSNGPRPADCYLLWGLMLMAYRDRSLLTPTLLAYLDRGQRVPAIARIIGLESVARAEQQRSA